MELRREGTYDSALSGPSRCAFSGESHRGAGKSPSRRGSLAISPPLTRGSLAPPQSTPDVGLTDAGERQDGHHDGRGQLSLIQGSLLGHLERHEAQRSLQ